MSFDGLLKPPVRLEINFEAGFTHFVIHTSLKKDPMSIISATLLLFLVMDPMGNIPLFISTLKNTNPARQQRIIRRELLIALFVLVIFMFAGKFIMQALQISDIPLSISGGIILFIIAIRMIFPNRMGDKQYPDLETEPLIVPLAIPLIAGPSALASVMLLMSQDASRWMEWLIALILAWTMSGIILLSSSVLSKLLGVRGLIALERLMGMILTTVAVQMILTGIHKFLQSPVPLF